MRGRTFWLVDAAAWLPLAASYATTFAADGHSSAPHIASSVVANVVPAALLGLPVLLLCSRLRWLRPTGSSPGTTRRA